ncbi:MAG: aldo/keto reductase family protein [Deltaproteobacteria bacterium]|jgi:voltage-dependent potassium channel beta subunit|nr:aldo/keto reductase family protein [Deltaproteobacteria bacterium]MBW2500734.1 aldo/keto reductase family protein [Deltaproteobacteria bacterium]
MQTCALGRSGLRVSRISFGSWLTLGCRVDYDETARLLHAAFDLGINLFDTADVYSDGDAEKAIGRALAYLPRHHVVLATKCFFEMSETPNDRGLSRKHLFESVEGSLQRLRTDYLDLHQCHRWDPDVPLEETIRAYDDLIHQGKILHWGSSHWSAAQIREACALADALGACRPISNQPEYSIMRRDIERDVLNASAREGIGQIVFSPLAQGALTGKYRGGQVPEESRAHDPKRNRWMADYLEPEFLARVERLRPIADGLGISLAQLALAWCLREPGVSSVIVGASRASQLEENVKALEVELPAEALEEIDAIFPGPPRLAAVPGG